MIQLSHQLLHLHQMLSRAQVVTSIVFLKQRFDLHLIEKGLVNLNLLKMVGSMGMLLEGRELISPKFADLAVNMRLGMPLEPGMNLLLTSHHMSRSTCNLIILLIFF